MSTKISIRAATGLASVLLTVSSSAHHSWARYDGDRIISRTGIVTRVEWANPHVIIAFSVTDDGEEAVEWTMEMDPPTLLNRYGLRHDVIVEGMQITVTGVGAKNGAPMMRAVTITLADGTVHRVSSRV